MISIWSRGKVLMLPIKKIREHMMNAAKLKVPLDVSIDAGNNWDEAFGDWVIQKNHAETCE